MRRFLLSLVMAISTFFALADVTQTISYVAGGSETITGAPGESFSITITDNNGAQELQSTFDCSNLNVSDWQTNETMYGMEYILTGSFGTTAGSSCPVLIHYYGDEADGMTLSFVTQTQQSTITYTIPDVGFCYDDVNMVYTIEASEQLSTNDSYTIDLTVKGSTSNTFSYTGTVNGKSVSFTLDCNNSPAWTFDAVVKKNGTEIGTSTIYVVNDEPVTITSLNEAVAGEPVQFTASCDDWRKYSWSVSGEATFVDGNQGQTVEIIFPKAGDYTVYCYGSYGNGGSAHCSESSNTTTITIQGGSSSQITYTAPNATLCKGGDMAYTVTASESIPSTTTLKMVVGLESFTGYSKGESYVFDLSGISSSSGTFNAEIVDVTNNNTTVATPTITIFASPYVVIESQSQSFSTGTSYEFTATSDASNGTYSWSMGEYPNGGTYEFVNGYSSQSTTIKFSTAGQYELWCTVTDGNGCSSNNFKYVTVEDGTVSDITYTAQPQTFCYKNDGQYEYVVKASQAVEEDDYIMVLLSYSSYYGSHHSDAIDGDEIYFRLNNLPAAEYEVMIYSSDSLNLLVESASLTVGAPIRPTISWEDGEFYVGETVSFYNENYDETLTYTWSVDNVDHTFVGATDGEGVSITFLNTGDFVVKCEATENGCTSLDTYSLKVVNVVCSIDGTKYSTLTEALQAVQSGDEIIVLNDIDEEEGNVDVNKSFTLNTNNHVVSFGQISGMASRTITGGGVLNTALDNSNTNGSDVLTVDGATLNLAGTQWMAKNVAITNSGNITLTSNIFLGGGNEDGFNLSIDEGSSFNINGQSISGYNTERVAAQIGQYLPSGYTVSDDLVFSPDANVTLSVQSADPITYTAEAVTTCFNEWDEGEFVVTASDVVEGSYVMTFGEYEVTTQRTDGVEIYFELKNIPAGTYNVTVWNSDKSTQLCTSTLTVLDASLNVEGPEEGVTNEPLTFTVTNPVSGVTYEWVVEMYGGDSNSPADPSSYTADSFEGTTFTVTFLEADENYRITCNSSCGYGTEMALSISEAQPALSVSFPQDEYEITIGDSTYVCLNITSEEPNFNLDLVTIAIDDTEGGVQFMETQNKGCFYIKALSTAGSSTEVSATVTYNNKEYYATTLVRFKEAPFEWENCPDAPLNFEDGSYELQISQWFDVSSYSYSWSSSNEDVATVAADGTVTFVAPGYTEILCTATNLYDQTGVVQAQCPLHIEGETEFTISEKSTLTVCQGESATVVITAEPAASFIVVSEDNETIYTADNEDYVTLTPTMTTAGDYTYYIVEDGTQKKSFTITVNEKPTVTITALQSVVCVGDTVQLEAHMNLSDGSFFWGGADNFDDATSGNPKFVATYDGHYPIFCQVTGAGNCVGTEELSLQVYPKPTVTISGPTEATVDTEVEYTATLSTSNIPATATFTYAWGGGVESYDTETIAKGSFSESDIEEGAEVFCIVSTTDGTCADTAKYPVVVKANVQYWVTDTVFCYGAEGFVTIESSEAINTAAFGVQTSDGTSVNFEPVVSPDNNQNNVVVIKYENIRNYGNGTYYITSKGEPVGSFQVVVNYAPRATFSCPTSDEAVVDETWNVSAPMAEGATYNYMWSSDGISFNDASSATQSITFETAGPVWVVLSVEDAVTGCVGNSDTCRFTIDAGGQKYFVPEEVTWCHGAESGRVTIPVTSNQEIPASLTVNHDWATNIETEINGTEATISFDYPYNGPQGFQLITIEGGDTTVVVENVNAFGKGHLLPSFPEDQDSVVIFGNGNTIELMAGGNAGSTSGSWYTALGSQARFNWTKDDEVSQECLANMINEGADCNNARVRFTFPQTGTYSVGFSISDDGCTSDFIYKNIYVVDFDPALFTITPVKDTIEIGAPNGAQFTLNYDGEPYSNYTLKSDGDVTIDGTSVFDNEIVGTFEVYAEVSDLRVATAWITVVERPIEYTVENVSVCEGTDEAEAVIYASGSIEGKTVTVRDEDGNTLYPEYNDNNDAATLHLNYLSVGTYTYTVYENDVYKTEFTVRVNSLPRAYIECPTNPVVGDTWAPNTAMAEGLTYHWGSDNISSLDGTMSCCPTVTFTEAGTFSATLVVKDNETGCLSEGTTCEFTVEEPVSYVKVFETYYNEYGTCVDGDGISDIWYRRGDNLGNEFTIAAQDAGVDDWGSAPQVGESFTVFMKGMANFTGKVSLFIVDEREEANYWAELTPYASEFYVAEGQQFEYEGLLKITNTTGIGSNNENVDLINPNFQIVCLPDVTSTQAGFDDTKVLTLSLTDYSMTYSEGSQQNVCDGNSVAFTHSTEESGGSTIHVYELVREVNIENPSTEDSFELEWAYTSNFTAKSIDIALVDLSQGNPTPYANPDVTWSSLYLVEGEQVTRTMVFSLPANSTEKSTFAIAAFITSNEEFDNPTLCESEFIFKKQGEIVQECTTLELDGENSVQLQPVSSSVEVGDTYNYEVFGTAQFTGDLFFCLVDQSEEVGYWDMLADSKSVSVVEGEHFEIKGAFTVTKEPTSSYPGIYFTVGRIDANQSGEIKTICVLNSAIYKAKDDDECYNKIYVDGGNSAVVTQVYPYQMEVGDVYEYYISGKADFTGEAMVSFTDVSEEVDYYFPLADIVTFEVTEGESFSQRGTFVVKNQTPSEYPDFSLMIAKNNGVTGETSSFCIDGAYIERQVQSYTMSEQEVNMFVGGTKYIYLLADGQPFSGDVEWGVTDLSGSTTPCVKVDYGEIYANSEGQAKIYAKVNDQVVATAIVTVTTFSCDGGELYTVANNGDMSYIEYPLSGITAGDSYKVTINGKTDYDGVLVTAVADFSAVSEDDGPSQGSNLGEIMVKAGQEFSYNTILTVVPTAASAPNYKMILVLGGSEELDEFNLCATQFSVENFTAQYTLDGLDDSYMFVGETKQLTIKNIDGTVYGGDAQWVSTDENVVAIGDNGYVYAKSVGVAEVQVIIGGDIAATAFINVENATDITIGLDKPGYEIENVGDEQIVYINASGLQAATFTYQYDESIIEVTPIQGTNTLRVKGLKVGSTHLFVTATLDGESHEAGAVVEVGGSTSNDYTLAFAQSKYEITEGESMSACLTIGEGFKHFDPQFNFDQTVISISNPTDGSDCGTITGLLAGHTFVEVIAAAPDGKSYSAQTEVIVNAKQLPYFVKQQSIAIEVGESEQITVMIFDGGSAQASLFTFETSDATVATVGRDGVVTAIAVGNAEVSVFFEGSLVGKVAVAVDVAPQMPTPGYNTNVLTMCFDKSATTNGGTSLERMVYPTSDFGKLKWYDASGNELSAAPVVSAAQAGKAVYYVSQIGMGELANYRESEKVPYTVEIVYVAEPKLNVTDQSTCQGATAVPFVATTNTENVVEWTDVTGAVVAQGTEFLPQVPTSGYYTYKVTAKNTMGCVSNPLTVTYTVGNAVKPEIFVATQAESFVVGEPVTLGTSNQMSDDYSVVWSLGDNEYVHGTAFTTQFEEVGTYTVTCKVVETNTGCADSASKVITVEEKVIPLQSIVVEPETVTLYEGEQGYVSLAFEPSYASNMAYTIEVEDTEVADVAGLTVWAVAEGTTKATITSVENPDVKAEFNIVVNKLIKAKEISMPNIITLALNEETKVAASVIPAEASYNKVAFKEKTDNVISIDAEGNIKALGEGTSTIVAYSNGGLQATAVVYVTAAQTAITDIAVPDEIELKLRDSVVVSYKVTPVTLAAKLLEWAIENNDIATFSNGVVKAVSAGETNLTVSIGNISKTIKIKVTTSSAPVIGVAPKLAFEQGKNITVDFADFVSDDETELANLTFEATSDDLNVSIDGTVATITAKSDSYAGTTSFTLSVTDEDGLTTSADVPVEVTEKANQAPVVLIEDVQIKYNACTYLKLSDIFSDDNTSWKKLKYTFTAKNVSVKVCMKTQLSMISTNPDLEYDTLFVTVTDAEGLTTEAEVIMYVNSLPNRAPKIAEIPVQSETDDAAFGTIELANYVKDDYTAASSIKWTTSSSDNLSVTIDEGVASVEVLNAFWNGAEAITFYAADEDGLKDSTVVYYSRKVTINEETVSSGSDNELTPVVWEGAPVVNIMAMKFIGVPGEQFIIMASMSGYDCTWAWEIEGANGIDQTSLMQMVSFDNPGTYTVKLTVQSADGQHSIEVVKENLLTVVGINERTPAICKGDAVTLTASEGLDSYYWSTGDVKNTTTARPDATTLYKLTMKKGMFTLVDTVTVKVSVPVALMEDSVMCAGTTFDLEAIGDYVSYAWNTGDVEKSITIPSEVASYTVTAVDGMQCVSVDTFNLTKVNDLPAIDLGEDQTPCDGTTVTLDAGTGYEYLWSTGATSQTIDLTANTETVWARIIDANKCINYDTVVVAFTYPYPEQIGVATFSETTNHIILAWEKTAGVNTVSYAIERETGVTGNWEQVGDDVMFSESGIVVDEDVNYKETAFKYRLVTTDACGNKAYSEPHRSMVSSTMWQTNGLQTIHWTAYKPFANVTQYKILRGYEATQMDTVIDIPASDDEYFIWNETDPQYTDDINVKYRVVFRLKSEVNENAVNTLDGQPVEGYYTKAESGPFSLAMSNIAEVETDVSVSEIAFPADVIVYPTTVSSYINVAIASPEDNNFIVEVLNANGQVVARVQTGEISKTLLQISAEGLRQGVYTVRISDGQQSTSVKVVK